MAETRWHKGSRFWIAGTAIMLLMVLFALAILIWWGEHGATAIERVFTLAFIYMGGAAAKSGIGEFKKTDSG